MVWMSELRYWTIIYIHINELISEIIFFAINLLQFFKIKFGKFGGIINISDWLHWKSNNHIGSQLSFLKLIHLYEYI